MAISANSVFEVRTAGSDTNGGGFVTGASGTDYSQQNSANSTTPNKSTTDAVTAATTTVTSATAGFTAAIVGNIIYLAGGTGTLTGAWYQVTAFTNSTTITIDRAPGVSTGVTMNIGGALASPGQASGIMVTGNIVYIQNVGADGASVYSISSATVNIAGGTIGTTNEVFYQGYSIIRVLGGRDNRPQLKLTVTTTTLFTNSSAVVSNLFLNGNGQTSAKLVSTTTQFYNCLIENFNTATSGNPFFYLCSATTNSAAIFTARAIACEAFANTATPFNSSFCIDCISSGNTGATTDGFGGSFPQCYNCISISNGRHGFSCTTGVFVNCHAESNAQFGFSGSGFGSVLLNCSGFSNSSGLTSFSAGNATLEINVTSITAGSVFVNAAGFNFALNNTANQGALLRAAGDPATFPRGLTSNYRDIGAAQHKDSPSTTNIFVIDD